MARKLFASKIKKQFLFYDIVIEWQIERFMACQHSRMRTNNASSTVFKNRAEYACFYLLIYTYFSFYPTETYVSD